MERTEYSYIIRNIKEKYESLVYVISNSFHSKISGKTHRIYISEALDVNVTYYTIQYLKNNSIASHEKTASCINGVSLGKTVCAYTLYI